MECTLTGCEKKGSLLLTKINECNSVQSQSNLNFSGSPLCQYYTINVLWTDIISPPAQIDIYFCFVIPSCAAAIFGHRRWLNSAADVQKEGERGDRKNRENGARAHDVFLI